MLACALALVQSGCGMKKEDASSRHDVMTPTSPTSAVNDDAAAPTRDRVTPIRPRHEGTRVVFSGGRVGWLTGDRAIIVSIASPAAATTIPLGTARGIAATPAGFVLIGDQGSHTVHRIGGGTAAESWPAALMLSVGIVHLFPEDDRFWVSAHDGLQPVELRIRGTALAKGARIKLMPQPAPGNQYDVARLADGHFVRLEGDLFRIDPSKPESQLLALPTDVTSPSLLAAHDQRIWLARPGEIVAVTGDPLAVAARAPLPSPEHRVHSLAASSAHVAAIIRVQASESAVPVWTVVAFDTAGKPAFSQPLPPELSGDLDVSVAISPAHVAAAGPGRLIVWDLANGTTLLDRAPD